MSHTSAKHLKREYKGVCIQHKLQLLVGYTL